MAKQIIKYQAKDHTLWNTEGEANKRDNLLLMIAAADALLLPGTNEDGKFVQQSESAVKEFKRQIVTLAAVHCPHKIWASDIETIHPHGLAGRLIDDAGSPLWRPWGRLAQIDKNFREYSQPYYAVKADKE